MSHHCKDCKQKHSLFTDILKARKMKIQREKRIIDRVLEDKMRKIPQLNPENFYSQEDPSNCGPEGSSASELSISNSEYKIRISRKVHPRKRSPLASQQIYLLSQEDVLNERAKQFISRLRKQKQYNDGKMFLMRKREEEKRELEAELQNMRRRSLDLVYRKEKINKLMDSIIAHEGRISERAVKSLKKDLRSKTENWQREDLVKSLNVPNDDLYSLRKRVRELSDGVDYR